MQTAWHGAVTTNNFTSRTPWNTEYSGTTTIPKTAVLQTEPCEDGVPDGMCIDEDDNLWLAVWGGNRIEKHDGRTGELLAVVEVDAKQTSSCCFTDDGKKLLITSAGVGLDGESEGRLFVCAVK